MLFLGAVADPLGSLHAPGPGAVVFLLLVVAVTSLLAYGDHRAGRRARK
jgi:hypothetical protein